jgi:hypothetical protein
LANKKRNAADEKGLKRDAATERYSREKYLNDIRQVLGTPSGCRFVWSLLEKCKTFNSVWEPSARIHYNAGKQDLGHEIMAEIAEADEILLFNLMKDNYSKGELDNV